MTKAGCSARLAQEAKACQLITQIFFADGFQCHGAAQIDVERLVSDSHGTTGSSLLFPKQPSATAGPNYLPTLQDALAGRIILQMDQAASANQALLRKLHERSQDSGLDRSVRLRAGGDLEKGA